MRLASIRKSVVCAFSFFVSITLVEGEDALEPGSILEHMKRAADWQLDQPYTVDVLEWDNAPFFAGLSDLSEVSGEQRYLDSFKAIAEELSWALAERRYHADDHAIGLTYLKLYQRDGDANIIKNVLKTFDAILDEPNKEGYYRADRHLMKPDWTRGLNFKRWTWCDALYMSPPIWAGLAEITGEEKYLDFMVGEWRQTVDWLWDEEEKLFFRDDSYFEQRTPSGAKIFWGRGNGWVFGGLVEVLQYLPEDSEYRRYFVDTFQAMAIRILDLQQSNGTWAPSLLDENHIAQDESSGTAFYVYGLAWGVNNGLLDYATCGSVIESGWASLCERLTPEGKLINVQPVGHGPEGFDPNTSVIYGTGAFLSAGSEVLKLSRSKRNL